MHTRLEPLKICDPLGLDQLLSSATVKILGSPFWVGRVYSLKIWVVVTQIYENWISATQFLRVDTTNSKV